MQHSCEACRICCSAWVPLWGFSFHGNTPPSPPHEDFMICSAEPHWQTHRTVLPPCVCFWNSLGSPGLLETTSMQYTVCGGLETLTFYRYCEEIKSTIPCIHRNHTLIDLCAHALNAAVPILHVVRAYSPYPSHNNYYSPYTSHQHQFLSKEDELFYLSTNSQ